ncbi:3'-5' exonuclease [Luteimonas sp. SDU82]|uniref:3'-5' exonuclease n=1 Tax=Luteimonas sp. SDU82 TaxID=3422592 RepID=UPI003EBEC967
MSYEIAFTRGFKDGLEVLPKDIYPIVNRQVSSIAENPYERDPNRRRMKNAPRTFRARIGIHVRMLYRVLDQTRQINFLGIGPRGSIYDRGTGRAAPLSDRDRDALLEQLRGAPPQHGKPQPDQAPTAVVPVEIEELEWICEDELFLLQIPQEVWPTILKAGSVEALQTAALDSRMKVRIEDYWTNPRQTQVEKLYTLSPDQGVDTIAQRPLSEFLILLDPEQRSALQRIRGDGPYLLKGSAGTGKSLVGLYHMRDLIESRAGESLFEGKPAWFGVITYTNTLVDANLELLRSITPESSHRMSLCRTLDKIAYKLATLSLGRRPQLQGADAMTAIIDQVVRRRNQEGSAEVLLLDKLGASYIASEIEQMIIGNGLEELQGYLEIERRGRRRALRREEREALWQLYLQFMSACRERNMQTWEQCRLIALNYLRNHPEYPRFSSLFVDEAQDFSKTARQLCLELVADPKNLLLAADSGQSIYATPQSWRKCDLRFNFQRRRPILLSKSYRATWQIGQAIAPLRSDPGDEDDQSANAAPVFSGPKPSWIDVALPEHPKRVAEEVEKLVRDSLHPIQAGLIAIIVRDSPRATAYQNALSERGIECAVVTKGAPLQVRRENVHIITAHSSKGLGFPVVFVPDVSASCYPPPYLLSRTTDQEQRDELGAQEQRLLYVALSRASHRLYMIVDREEPSVLVSKLDRSAHWDTK